MVIKNLSDRSFNAVVLGDLDPKNQGRYRVHIPDLEPLLPENVAIWVKNHIHKYRDNSDAGFRYGQYFPIQKGTRVLVRFYNANDINSGYIDRILDDDIPDQEDSVPLKYSTILPFNLPKEDRDDIYQIIRTPKYDCLFLIAEDIKSELVPRRSIHLYYNRDNTCVVLDELGFHFKTIANEYHYVEDTYSIQVNHNFFQNIRHNVNIRSGGEFRLTSHYDSHLRCTDGSLYIQADNNALFLIAPDEDAGQINMVGSKYVNIAVPDGYFAAASKEAARICSEDEITTTAKVNNMLLAGSMAAVVGVGEVIIASDGVITLSAPKVVIDADVKVSGMIEGVITHACKSEREGKCPRKRRTNNLLGHDMYSDHYEELDPMIYEEIEDGFFDDYELDNYTTLPDDADMAINEKGTQTCRGIMADAYHKTHIPAVQEVTYVKDGREYIKYFSKFKYDNIQEQQEQNKQADNMFNVRALTAQKGNPPPIQLVEFEGNQ